MTDNLREDVSRSAHSPGVVTDGETLLRVGYAPEHILDGEILVAAIRSDDLADLRRGGFSVDRAGHVDEATLRDRARIQMERRPASRKEAFVSTLSTSKLRSEFAGDRDRAFVVLDTATPDNIAHGSIVSAKQRRRSQIKELKDILARHLRKRLDIGAFIREWRGADQGA